jgi:hypothetical protein
MCLSDQIFYFGILRGLQSFKMTIVNPVCGLFCHRLDEKRSHKRNRHRYRGIGII